MPDVYDGYGALKDWEWLTAKYGNVQHIEYGDGEGFMLVRVDETLGPAAIIVQVRDRQGQPDIERPVGNYWPQQEGDCVELLSGAGLMTTLGLPTACVQYTNANGDTGYGLGAGSYYYNLNIGGPHTLWVLSPSLPSDGISGVGMLGHTNHHGPLRLTFMRAERAPGYTSLEEALVEEAQDNQVIQFNPSAALQRAIFAAGMVPNSGEFDVTWAGVDYVAQRAEDLQSGVVHVYYAASGDWGNVRYYVSPYGRE